MVWKKLAGICWKTFIVRRRSYTTLTLIIFYLSGNPATDDERNQARRQAAAPATGVVFAQEIIKIYTWTYFHLAN
jgi:hypothetical protein